MQHIETVTVGSGGASSITFSSIPDTYTDLLVKYSLRSSRSGEIVGTLIQFNGSSANFTARDLLVTVPPSAGSSSFSSGRGGLTNANTSTSNTFGSMQLSIPNYRSSANKSYSIESVAESNATMSYNMNIVAGLWSNSNAITSITLAPDDASNWLQYSSASLYGILAGSDGTTVVS